MVERIAEVARSKEALRRLGDRRGRRGPPPHPRLPARPHRPRLLDLQARDRPAPRRPAHAGDADAEPRRLCRLPPRDPGGGAEPVQRPADLGDGLLPRPRRLRSGGARGLQAAVRAATTGEDDGADQAAAGSVGCATGEEAYSLAILLLEEAERREVAPAIQIFATDLDDGALATAREGRYPAGDRGRRLGRRACAASSSTRAPTTASARKCATSCSSPTTARSRTRRSCGSTSSPAATC